LASTFHTNYPALLLSIESLIQKNEWALETDPLCRFGQAIEKIAQVNSLLAKQA